MSNVPVAIIASNRPHYLYTMLRTLLATPGVNKSNIVVFIDGFFQEPLLVTQLFSLKAIQHAPLGRKNARVSQHYKASLKAIFSLFPAANHALVLEEDLDVSPDLFAYFSQTLPLLEDPSLYCISAWNDLGYEHSVSQDASLLMRVETMPGLGWLLKRSLYNELESKWPPADVLWDWDMWLRLSSVRKGRECIIPDVSRTYHFGSSGLNMNSFFHERYFKNHAFNRISFVNLSHSLIHMKRDPYEQLMKQLIVNATLLPFDPCDLHVNWPESGLYLYAFQMNTSTDQSGWLRIAKCLKVWDLDARGSHGLVYRLFPKPRTQLLVIGVPYSRYSKLRPLYIPASSTYSYSSSSSIVHSNGANLHAKHS